MRNGAKWGTPSDPNALVGPSRLRTGRAVSGVRRDGISSSAIPCRIAKRWRSTYRPPDGANTVDIQSDQHPSVPMLVGPSRHVAGSVLSRWRAGHDPGGRRRDGGWLVRVNDQSADDSGPHVTRQFPEQIVGELATDRRSDKPTGPRAQSSQCSESNCQPERHTVLLSIG